MTDLVGCGLGVGELVVGEYVMVPCGPTHVLACIEVIHTDSRVDVRICIGQADTALPTYMRYLPVHWLKRGAEVIAYRVYRKIITAPKCA